MITLVPGPGPDGTLTVDGFRPGTEVAQALSDPSLADAVRAATVDLSATLYDRDPAWAPFWCPTCERSYCGSHWRLAEGSYGFLGTCPYGHRRGL
ncbi:hypothetical protein [Actinocatenispora rupis]|uniref:Uncharacterized protein n=1 Tax=Actinocatenispora rupis TaxID=519421 RepID=A0A8J3JHV3_9ACTN|nr:hypothetical protein [Actinocatenispora rupis]GID16153.1 hypothetical protein Aru02nite_70420 [Actinocatenispora rupis]